MPLADRHVTRFVRLKSDAQISTVHTVTSEIAGKESAETSRDVQSRGWYLAGSSSARYAQAYKKRLSLYSCFSDGVCSPARMVYSRVLMEQNDSGT